MPEDTTTKSYKNNNYMFNKHRKAQRKFNLNFKLYIECYFIVSFYAFQQTTYF